MLYQLVEFSECFFNIYSLRKQKTIITIENDIFARDALVWLLWIDREWSPFVFLFHEARHTKSYLRNRKHVRVSIVFLIEARVEVWEHEKCWGNTSRGLGFPVSSGKRSQKTMVNYSFFSLFYLLSSYSTGLWCPPCKTCLECVRQL